MDFQKEKLDKVPESPGVYQFIDRSGSIIYVGKAVNLKRRINSYFRNVADGDPKIILLRAQMADIMTIPTASEFDALLLESKLIRKYQPRYNIIAKDDKSPLYIKFTLSDELPRILFIRKTRFAETKKKDIVIGPFQSARITRKLLSSIRHAIPYCLQKRRDGKPCFYTHLGLCSPCPSEIVKIQDPGKKQMLTREYRKNIRRLVRILSGKSHDVITELEKSMRHYANVHEFESAGLIKNQLENLRSVHTRHHDPVVYEYARQTDEFGGELEELQLILKRYYPFIRMLKRIECIDISNLARTLSTGSLVVLLDGLPASFEYRKFKIRTHPVPDDATMVAEVLNRRLGHPEWPYPNLMVIDGGKPQVRQADSVIRSKGLDIPVIGLAKRFEEIIIPNRNTFSVIRLPMDSKALHVVERIRDEAHRFAKSYHLKLRQLLNRKFSVV